MPIKILVTGANGFIGQHVVSALIHKGVETIACGRSPSSIRDDVTQYISCDLLTEGAASELCRAVRPTHLMHLAWDVTTASYWDSEENMRWLWASQRLVDEFIDSGGQRFVGVGTCAEYSQLSVKRDEAHSPTIPDTIYGKAKLALADYLCLRGALGLNCAWGRLFYLLGPGEPEGRLVPSALRYLQNNETFICKNGEAILDYMDVRDAAEALSQLALSDLQGSLNIASGSGIRIRDLLSLLAKMNKSAKKFVFEEAHTPGICVVAETRRLRHELGFTPKYSLEESLGLLCSGAVSL